MNARNPFIRIRNLKKIYPTKGGEVCALQDVTFDVFRGEFITLVGPSGCGKTTTLRMIGGFENPTRGDILLDHVRINDIPANKRDTCMVFQSYALFPHMNIYQNVETII